MTKFTNQQEVFIQEIIKGKTQYDAYLIAYPKSKKWERNSVDCEASKLMANTKILQRIKELKAEVHQEVMSALRYDREAHFKELELCRQLAMTPRGDNGNINENAVIKATELKGKVCGLYTQEAEVQIGTKGITVKIITNG